MKRRESLGLDLTPVIDVIFILLIFFIVTSVFKKEELALILDLPTSNAKEMEVKQDQVFIELNQNKLAIKGIEVSFESALSIKTEITPLRFILSNLLLGSLINSSTQPLESKGLNFLLSSFNSLITLSIS